MAELPCDSGRKENRPGYISLFWASDSWQDGGVGILKLFINKTSLTTHLFAFQPLMLFCGAPVLS